jgi:hypothetical protein
MEMPMTERTSKPARAIDPDDVLAELLAECREGVRMCFEVSNDPEWGDMTRCEAMNAAARLMKTSIALAAALKKKPDFTHRIIVEHAPATQVPPPPGISSKTIHGIQTDADHKIG